MTALAKRKWTEPDWDVAMAAHSFVAVLASRPDQERAGERLPKKTPTNARATKPRHAQTDDDGTLEATKDVATCTFWLAQLQDDVTEDMLAAHDETSVRVTWLQHTAQRRYVVTYDDCVDVASILCQVRLCEPTASTLEMTAKSLLRVQRCLARSRAARAGQPVAAEEDDDDDDERLRPSLSLDSRNRCRAAMRRRTTSSAKRVKIEGRTPRDRGGSLLLPVLRAEVDEAAYEDLEVLGTQPFRSFRGDVASANREVVRAVLTKNLKLLEMLTTSAHVYAELSTFDAPRSADVARTALHYAIDHDDLAAAVLLHRTKTIDAQKLAAAPEVALPSHSTGRHTSQYSAYDRRAVNASRGGKEGNNALLGDCTSDRTPSLDYLWRSPDTSVEMFTLMYPVGDWTKGYDMGAKVCQAARCGNFRLVRKVVETLEKNGGWGFNELHYRVLADCTANNHGGHASLLPPFRAVSALKQASQTRLRPLHLACINPNSKFLAALWVVVGDEFGAVKDDQGYEPIHYAAVCEFAAPMEFLLERRCNSLGRTKTRLTPLMCALEAGREETAIALLKFAVRLRESGGESQEVVGKLVREKGPGEVNATSNGTSKATPLVLAAQEGHIECVRVLLANGARVDSGDKQKKTPLILAVKNGHTRVAAVLINGGANVNAYDSSGNSVAHYAASYGWPSCLQMLCDVGAELWSQNAWGFLPLACAMLKQRRSCAEIILAQISCAAHQASLNFRDREGRTVLFSHCQHSHNLEQLGYLLGKGMNPNIGNSNGHLSTFDTLPKDEAKQKVMAEVETAMHFIARQKQLGEVANSRSKSLDCTDQTTECLMDVLLEKRPELFSSSRSHQVNALVNFVDLCTYKTALHYAVEMGNEPTVRVLLEHQADANLSPVRCANCSEFAVADAVARAKPDTFVSRDTNLSCTGHCGLHTRVEPALYESVKRRHVKCTRLLLKHGARVDCVGRLLHESPLHVALKANDCASASALLSHGASLLTQDISGASPLHLAVAAKHSVPAKKANVSEVAYSTVSIAQLLPAGRPVPAKAAQFSVTLSTDANQPHKQQAPTETSAILIALNNANAHKAVVLGDSKNRSIVHYAARNRDLDLLRELLRTAGESGVRDAVNQRDYLGRTPLHYAVNAAAMSADASFAVERFLLQSGAISSTQDCFGFGVLHFALVKVQLDWQEKHEKMHKLLRDQKDRVGHSFGAEKHEVEKAFLVEHLSVIPDRETDPVETVSNLVAECNLDIMAQDILGRSPLHLSAATGAFVCVSTLLTFLGNASKQKACMAQQDHDGFTPLGQAILHKRQTTIMTLLRSGSTVGGTIRIARQPVIFRDGFASCPLASSFKGESMVKTRSYFHHAVRNGLTGVCHMLLSANFCRRQAIEDSVRCSQFQLANKLLEALVSGSEHGSELLRRPNSRGETLLHSLAKTKQTVFCTLAKKLAWALLGAGVRVDDRDKMGNIAMHYAAKRGNTHLMDFLRHHSVGANTENVKNRAGEIPLVYAFKQKSTSGSSSDDQLFAVLCYFLEHPLLALDINHADDCGVNVISAFLDRFTESLAVAKPVLYFTMLETLLARGADPNQRFHVAHATALEQWNDSCGELYEGSDRLLRSGRKLRETTTLAKGGMGTLPPLIRVALTPDASIRFHALALLLRYGAKLSTCDGKGNTVLMHLVARNLVAETRLVLGLVRSVPDPKDMFALAPVTRMCSLHIPEAIVKEVLGQRNANGLTACHIAVQPLDYGSYENTSSLAMLIRAGGDLHAKDSSGQDAIDYTRSQRSCFISRFLQRTYPEVVSMTQARKIEIATDFAAALPYVDDANAYLAGCKLSGKIKQSHILAKVNANCNVGKESKVCREGEGRGIALDALLTKVDVRSGRFGSNVFYRLQLVHDELQTIFVLFTNWGRIGETGKFQNTPFRDEAEARSEFKKIFRSKTGNTWESRTAGNFVKKPKKYNLIERVNYSAKVDDEVTRSFRADMEDKGRKRPVFVEPSDPDLVGCPSVMTMLAAITDVHNLQLAAESNCGYAGGDLPLAKQEELRLALEKLVRIRGLLEEKEKLMKEIETASCDLSDEGFSKRALLIARHETLIEDVSERSSRYYEIMPCQETTLESSIKAFDQASDVNVEITRMRMLSDIVEIYKMILGAKSAVAVRNPLEYCYHSLQVRLAPLQPNDNERQLINRYFFGGLHMRDRQRYCISNVFEVERRGESERFDDLMKERPDLRATQTHLLWHGTKRTNLLGILSQGLRVAPPEAPHHGYAYGKGLYFANVVEKSLGYCGTPYALPVLNKEGNVGENMTKTHEVHYMLLCEVALGKSTELATAAAWTSFDSMHRGRIDSVKALATHIPDPRYEVVSPKCGAKLHLGRVKEVGRELPYDRAWAKTEPTPVPVAWHERDPKFNSLTQDYLARLVADKSFGTGDTHTVSTTGLDRQNFVQYGYRERAVMIELVSREILEADRDTDAPCSGAWCQATLKVTIRPNSAMPYSYLVRSYRNVLVTSRLAEGYKLVEPTLSKYAELVVYNEAQARIRYVVEVRMT
ncbi:unnamed protein product [Hyaloperonospora brassicae]|uniref:Poly [ADP-ribose] polymerase n=1 Tax=Hyaloperonospora brassicae TaxID=162125 RepID=A0AAV0TX10_HYABA|nr:unnamed protein product [Hyaloperonospora brassicae]